MYIAVEGCAHGELDAIYGTIAELESRQGIKVDLLLCCGDFQSVRNATDLRAMAVPPKYYNMQSFYKYYKGEKTAPVLTVFIGGNHEASNFLSELPYGGWVAPKIYFLGFAGSVTYRGVRIAGLSGIFKGHDYNKGRYEFPPYTEDSKRSTYHQRNLDVFRLKQLATGESSGGDDVRSSSSSIDWKSPVDIFMSHDWPRGVPPCPSDPPGDFEVDADADTLLRWKPHFEQDIRSNKLGSPPLASLLAALKPQFWFAGHLHVKFAALVRHKPAAASGKGKSKSTGSSSSSNSAESKSGGKSDKNESESPQSSDPNTEVPTTKFLALDKCLKRRHFLQVLHFEDTPGPADLCYDPTWLAILAATEDLQELTRATQYMPGPGSNPDDRTDFEPGEEELEYVARRFPSLTIPENFRPTGPYHVESQGCRSKKAPVLFVNPQTVVFCAKLGLPDWFKRIRDAGLGEGILEPTEVSIDATADQQNQSINDQSMNDSSMMMDDASSVMDQSSFIRTPNSSRILGAAGGNDGADSSGPEDSGGSEDEESGKGSVFEKEVYNSQNSSSQSSSRFDSQSSSQGGGKSSISSCTADNSPMNTSLGKLSLPSPSKIPSTPLGGPGIASPLALPKPKILGAPNPDNEVELDDFELEALASVKKSQPVKAEESNGKCENLDKIENVQEDHGSRKTSSSVEQVSSGAKASGEKPKGVDNAPQSSDTNPVSTPGSAAKRFKRRNAPIYDADDE